MFEVQVKKGDGTIIYTQKVEKLIVEDVVRAVNRMSDKKRMKKIEDEEVLKYKEADKVGCSHQQVSNILKGKYKKR